MRDIGITAQAKGALRIFKIAVIAHKIVGVIFRPDTGLYRDRELFVLGIIGTGYNGRYPRRRVSAKGHVTR